MRTLSHQPGTSSVAAMFPFLLATLFAVFAPHPAGGQTTAFEVTRTSDGTSLLKVLDSGNVGVGITAPATKLDVAGYTKASSGLVAPSLVFPSRLGTLVVGGNSPFDGSGGNDSFIDVEVRGSNPFANTTGSVLKMHRTDGATAGGITGTAGSSLSTGINVAAGNISFTAGNTGFSGFTGGQVNLKAGDNTGGGPGGNVVLSGGLGSGGVNGYLHVMTGGTERLRVAGSGNVGIGTASPAEKLDIAGTAQLTGFKMPTGATNGYVLTSDASGVGTWQAASGGGVGGSGTTNFLSKFTAPTTLGNAGIFEDGSGNVGVGTTGPLSKLDVRGVILGQTDGANVISVSSLNKAAILGASGGLAVSGASGRGAVTGITRSTNASEAALFAEVFSPGGATGLIVQQDGTGDIVQFVDLNTTVFVVKDGGNVGIGTTGPGHPLEMGSGAHVTSGGVWTNASSRAYKENISPLPRKSALETLAALRPVTYNYKVDQDERYVGFIAEDVPDLVASRDRKSLAPMDIVAVLTKVVQDQQQTIAQQQAELATLKASVARLEATLRPAH